MKIYARPNTDEQVIDNRRNPTSPSGFITMQGQKPEGDYIAQGDGTWALFQEPLQSLFDNKIRSTADKAEAILQPLIKDYPLSERISWFVQQAEAAAWLDWQGSELLNAEPTTPLLDNMIATQKEVTKELQAQRIMDKALLFNKTGYIFGLRQQMDKELNAIMNNTELTEDEKREQIGSYSIDYEPRLLALGTTLLPA